MMPKGWEEKPLGEIADLTMGYAFKSSDFVQNGVPLVRMGNLYQNELNMDRNPVYLPESFLKAHAKFQIQPGDILLSMTGTAGKQDYGYAVIVPPISKALLLNQRVTRVRAKQEASQSFLLYSMRSASFTSHIYSKPGGTKQANVSISDLADIKIALPPKSEQEKIAKILSKWDEAIEKLDHIIYQKEKRHQGLGVALLFNGTDKFRLDDLCTPKQWKTISSKDLLEDGIPVFGANSWIGFYSEANHQEDCIAVTCRGATCGTVNYVRGPSYITGNSMALDSLKNEIIDRNFLYFYLRAIGLNSIISGSAQPQITGAVIGKVEIKLPSLAEQVKVSTILMKATKEIDAFKQLKEKIALQKQGLMQQLLTGKRRVEP
jgi:type I restriction enzyme S subunit